MKDLGKKLVAEDEANDERMEEAIEAEIADLGLDVEGFEVEYDDGAATVFGLAADQDTLEKALVAVGNVAGVARVTDEMEVGETEAERAELAAEAAEAKAAREAQVAEFKAKIEAAREQKAEEEAQQLRREARTARRAHRKARRERRAARQAARKAAEESRTEFYTVVSGDTLGKIAERFYGDWSKYPTIFDANTPMLKDPDLIYPGQVLRIPPID